MPNYSNIKMGEVYLMRFAGGLNIQQGLRPGVIIQNNIGNKYSPNIIALPLTTSLKKTCQPTHVLVDADESGLLKNSMVLCENPECIAKTAVGKYLTTFSDEIMNRIAYGYICATPIISFMDTECILSIRKKIVDLSFRVA